MSEETAGALFDEGGIKIMPGDRRFAALCRGFNPRWQADPAYVRLVRTSEEVRAALQQAVTEPSPDDRRDRITVRSGGHCYEDFVCSEDVRVIIDVSLMDEIYEDPDMKAICVEAGATNGDLRKDLFLRTGRVLPGGSCPSVGVGGHIPVGGFGLLSRQFGLTVDYLYAVEVAVVDENRNVRLVVATRNKKDPNRDLWWAHTGGGGGNFGIVTRFWFRNLPQAPERVLLTASGWSWSQMNKAHFTQIINNFGEFFATTGKSARGRYGPLFAILLLTHRSQDKIGLIAQIDASVPEARDRLEEFLTAMDKKAAVGREPLTEAYGEYPALMGLDTPTMLPWNTVERLLGPVDNLRCGKHKSAYMRKPLPAHQIDALWSSLALEDPDTKRDAVVQIDSYGAAINTKKPADTAVIQRDSVLKLQHQVYWPAGQDGEDQLRWIRTLYKKMYAPTGGVPVPDGHKNQRITDGCYIGYPDVDLIDRQWNTSGVPWTRLYYGDHYGDLRKIKKRWDPLNIFRHKQSITPRRRA
ncbi:FAD-binding oxidoreductase [Actinomadura sp. KC06]|uniref:FAD-binding oxidoreductase n=1 Tax=Actinomadura sp. KC06 TaxID=2530369 RepID=UPI001FB728A7|nr:FAD-binding oxidoreductase [Actinomadura sp. KC06]